MRPARATRHSAWVPTSLRAAPAAIIAVLKIVGVINSARPTSARPSRLAQLCNSPFVISPEMVTGERVHAGVVLIRLPFHSLVVKRIHEEAARNATTDGCQRQKPLIESNQVSISCHSARAPLAVKDTLDA